MFVEQFKVFWVLEENMPFVYYWQHSWMHAFVAKPANVNKKLDFMKQK